MDATRREVLILIVGDVAAAACGGSGSGAGGNCLANGTNSQVELNHGHALAVPVTDINAGVQKTYYIRGSADQSHSVTPTAADFASLKQNTSAREVSSVNSSAIYGTHSHGVTVSCA